MSYTALYRKFRPASFDEVKGQDHIVTTLRNQIKNDRMSHAYLFTGTRGTGKTSIAKIFAKAVNCENPQDGSPCNECEMCKAISDGVSMNVIEIDAASNNGVDSVREIIDEVSYPPTSGRYKVYIIDEVHMLSSGAFNALLKTLEEPPAYVIFILATTEVHKIPITILSRCQRYDFKRISIETITDRLRELTDVEQISIEDRALRYIAKVADGSMRDALSLLDQCIAFYLGQDITYDNVLNVLGAVDTEIFSKLLRYTIAHDVISTIALIEDVVVQGRELGQFITDFTWYLRNLMLIMSSDDMEDVLDISSDNMALIREEAGMVDADTVMRYIRIMSELANQIKYSSQKRVLVEIAMIKLCKPAMESDNSSIVARLGEIEERLDSGDFAAPVQGAPLAQTQTVASEKALSESIPIADAKDIGEIVSRWDLVVTNCDLAYSSYMRKLTPKANSNGTLCVEYDSSDSVLAGYVKGDSFIGDVQNAIARAFQKKAEVSIKETEADNRTEPIENHGINFNIETESIPTE